MSTPTAGGGLPGIAIRRPVFTTMLMAGLVILGLFTFRRLPVDRYPDVDLPVVTIQTEYPGASAEAVEREVTRRLEEAFNPVAGVDRITSTSREGISQIVVEFDLGRDVDAAAQDIRTRIELVRRTLPAAIDPPVVQKQDPGALPILSLALASDVLPLGRLTTLADEQVRRALERVPGVGEVRLIGGVRQAVQVALDPARLAALGVTVPEVMTALRRQNLDAPAGRVEHGDREDLVRVTGRLADPAAFGDVVVAVRVGHPVRVRDIGTVTLGAEEQRSVALVDGRPAVALDLVKVSGANTVAVADAVRAALASIRAGLPAGASIDVIRDNSVQIRQSVDDVIHELVLGAVLTVLIVMLFLNDWKATVITALALPVSVISAFVLLGLLGFSLNMLTLMALSLSVGILVDDAIVVVENVVRHRELGKDAVTAAGDGTREIVLAVLATTLAIVAVFVPVAFMRGIVGRFFFQFGLTVAWAVLASLLVSFTLTPMLSARWGIGAHGDAARGGPFTRALGRFNAAVDRLAVRYRAVVAWALAHRRLVMAGAGASLVAAVALAGTIGGAFLPETDDGEFVVLAQAPEGRSLAWTRERIEGAARGLRALDGVAFTYATIGAGATGTVTTGEILVKLVPRADRSLGQPALMQAARRVLASAGGLETSVVVPDGLGAARAPLAIELSGRDADTLARLTARVVAVARGVPGVVDVRSSLGTPKPEFRVALDRERAHAAGVDPGALAATLRPLFAGETATRWEDPTGEERDVIVRLVPDARRGLDDLRQIPIPTQRTGTAGTVTVPLADVAAIDAGLAPAQVDRRNLQRSVTVSAGLVPGLSLADASARIEAGLAGIALPPGYRVQLGGDTEELAETGGYVVETLVLAVVLIFLVLASQLESFVQPVAIMLSLPLSLVGVLAALALTGTTLNMMSMIGVIMLMGLVVKNAILLVDNANERRGRGALLADAVIEAGAVRLRPILMTTLAMIAGMLPVAIGMGEGGAFRAPMARAVIGGLITSTILTLVVVPVAYSYAEEAVARVRTWRARRRGMAAPSAPDGQAVFGD